MAGLIAIYQRPIRWMPDLHTPSPVPDRGPWFPYPRPLVPCRPKVPRQWGCHAPSRSPREIEIQELTGDSFFQIPKCWVKGPGEWRGRTTLPPALALRVAGSVPDLGS